MFLTFFRPTHPPYQQTSAFPYIHLKHDVSISSYPPIRQSTHLINIGQVRKKSIKNHFFCARKVFPWIFFSYFLLTWAFGHPHPPTLSANVSNWPPPPTHLFDDVILKWSLIGAQYVRSFVSYVWKFHKFIQIKAMLYLSFCTFNLQIQEIFLDRFSKTLKIS